MRSQKNKAKSSLGMCRKTTEWAIASQDVAPRLIIWRTLQWSRPWTSVSHSHVIVHYSSSRVALFAESMGLFSLLEALSPWMDGTSSAWIKQTVLHGTCWLLLPSNWRRRLLSTEAGGWKLIQFDSQYGRRPSRVFSTFTLAQLWRDYAVDAAEAEESRLTSDVPRSRIIVDDAISRISTMKRRSNSVRLGSIKSAISLIFNALL